MLIKVLEVLIEVCLLFLTYVKPFPWHSAIYLPPHKLVRTTSDKVLFRFYSWCFFFCNGSWEGDREFGRDDQSGGALRREQCLWDQEGDGHRCTSRAPCVIHWPHYRWISHCTCAYSQTLTVESLILDAACWKSVFSIFTVQEVAEPMETLPSLQITHPVVTV